MLPLGLVGGSFALRSAHSGSSGPEPHRIRSFSLSQNPEPQNLKVRGFRVRVYTCGPQLKKGIGFRG